MIKLAQTTFSADPSAPPPERENLVLHHRTAQPAKAVAVLVHGWNGGRYETWGKFPEFLYSDIPDLDIAMYAYATGLRRLWLHLSNLGQLLMVGSPPRFDVQADTLAGALRGDLCTYEAIYLIGHSQGGLLCKAAVCRLVHNTNDRAAVARIAGLYLMASAQAGTRKFEIMPEFLVGEAQVLKPGSAVQEATRDCFHNNIDISARAAGRAHPSDRIKLPTFAVVPERDPIVSRISGLDNIPEAQRKTVPATHITVVKPEHRDDRGYPPVRDWILADLRWRDAEAGAEGSARQLDGTRSSRPASPEASDVPRLDPEAIEEPPMEFWSRPGAIELRNILGRAYRTQSGQSLRILATRGGIDPDSIHFDRATHRELWEAILETGDAATRLLGFVQEIVLKDPAVAAHHDEIRRQLALLYPKAVAAPASTSNTEAPAGMDRTTLRQIVDLLLPQVQDVPSQQALCNAALFGSPALRSIGFQPGPQDFATHLVTSLWEFDGGHGEAPALRGLLETLQLRYGADRAAAIEAIINRLWPSG